MHSHKHPTTFLHVQALNEIGGMERQQKAGQVEMCGADVLPKKCPREILEKLGVVFGEDHDELFVNAILPAAWSKRATHEPLVSDLIDDKGRRRGLILYKCQSHQRWAHMRLLTRFRVDAEFPCDEKGGPVQYGKHTHLSVVALDGDAVLECFGIRKNEPHDKEVYNQTQAQRESGCAWLTARHPQWEDETAYWD